MSDFNVHNSTIGTLWFLFGLGIFFANNLITPIGNATLLVLITCGFASLHWGNV